MAQETGGLTPLGKVVVALVVVGLVGLGVYLLRDTLFPAGDDPGGKTIDLTSAQQQLAGAPATPPAPGAAGAVEAADPNGITTVTEYKYTPQ